MAERTHSVSHGRNAEGALAGAAGFWPKGALVVRGDCFGQVETWAHPAKLAAPCQSVQCGCFGRLRVNSPRVGGGGCGRRWSRSLRRGTKRVGFY